MRPGPRDGFRWTQGSITYALELWHRRHLCTPTLDDWRYASDDHPSAATVQRVFGSWNRALRAAGFRVRGPGERRGKTVAPRPRPEVERVRWPRERILDAIRDWNARHGAPPSLREWRRASSHNPTAATVQRVFGSWNDAIAEAGLTPREPCLPAVPREQTHYRCATTGRWLPGSRLFAGAMPASAPSASSDSLH